MEGVVSLAFTSDADGLLRQSKAISGRKHGGDDTALEAHLQQGHSDGGLRGAFKGGAAEKKGMSQQRLKLCSWKRYAEPQEDEEEERDEEDGDGETSGEGRRGSKGGASSSEEEGSDEPRLVKTLTETSWGGVSGSGEIPLHLQRSVPFFLSSSKLDLDSMLYSRSSTDASTGSGQDSAEEPECPTLEPSDTIPRHCANAAAELAGIGSATALRASVGPCDLECPGLLPSDTFPRQRGSTAGAPAESVNPILSQPSDCLESQASVGQSEAECPGLLPSDSIPRHPHHKATAENTGPLSLPSVSVDEGPLPLSLVSQLSIGPADLDCPALLPSDTLPREARARDAPARKLQPATSQPSAGSQESLPVLNLQKAAAETLLPGSFSLPRHSLLQVLDCAPLDLSGTLPKGEAEGLSERQSKDSLSLLPCSLQGAEACSTPSDTSQAAEAPLHFLPAAGLSTRSEGEEQKREREAQQPLGLDWRTQEMSVVVCPQTPWHLVEGAKGAPSFTEHTLTNPSALFTNQHVEPTLSVSEQILSDLMSYSQQVDADEEMSHSPAPCHAPEGFADRLRAPVQAMRRRIRESYSPPMEGRKKRSGLYQDCEMPFSGAFALECWQHARMEVDVEEEGEEDEAPCLQRKMTCRRESALDDCWRRL